MNKRYVLLQRQLNKLSLRERSIIFIMLLTAIGSFWYTLLYVPQMTYLAKISEKIDRQHRQIALFEKQHKRISSLITKAQVKQQIINYQSLINKNRQLDLNMDQYKEIIIDQRELSVMLRAMLSQLKGLKLLDFSTIQTDKSELAEQSQSPKKASDKSKGSEIQKNKSAMKAKYYRMILSGDYFTIANYLRSIEALDWRIYWTNLNYHVDSYPVATAEITFYTLSLSHE